ncbi:DUF6458 family protein [Actinomadura rupiterrae]|uniref:DUF6458 family protein n=1 Tax=Actinomadura rupiterrae TaxID=559627 RepID=UPI0020A54433|nr:DUF6458 family protein [Actinomadura rupiterrae]MCP2340562.1 hypothetical protein [Actinomadura rupiterrae]
MGIGVSLAFVALGMILAFAVRVNLSGLDIHLVGWILILVGVISMVFTFAYTRPRRRTQQVAGADPGYDLEPDRPVVEERLVERSDEPKVIERVIERPATREEMHAGHAEQDPSLAQDPAIAQDPAVAQDPGIEEDPPLADRPPVHRGPRNH